MTSSAEMTQPSQDQESQNSCGYCGKSFRKLSSLAVHLCEPKRRAQQEKEVGVQIGFMTFKKFYDMAQGGVKQWTYADFSKSPYYSAFVKFGQYCVSIRAVNVDSFSTWLLKNNKKIDNWTSDRLYEEWLYDYLKKESVQDALERAIGEMGEFLTDNPDIKSLGHYFLYGNPNKICFHIVNGRVSPWVVYNCDSGVEFLGQLGADQIRIIMPVIDPDFWQKKFKDTPEDVAWVRDILKAAGL